MPARKTARKTRGGALKQSGNGFGSTLAAMAMMDQFRRMREKKQEGNGFLSNFLPGPMGQMASMVGLGRRPRTRRVRGGNDAWKGIARNIINMAGTQGISDLNRLLK